MVGRLDRLGCAVIVAASLALLAIWRFAPEAVSWSIGVAVLLAWVGGIVFYLIWSVRTIVGGGKLAERWYRERRRREWELLVRHAQQGEKRSGAAGAETDGDGSP